VELADLVDHFPPRFGRLVGASIFPPEWNPAPWRIPVAGGYVTVGPFPRDDRQLIHLKTSDRTMLHVLVVPPGFSHAQADAALLASAADGNVRSGTQILQDVAELRDLDPIDHWSDDGGSWGRSNGTLLDKGTEGGR